MSTITTRLQVAGLSKRELAKLRSMARKHGITPQEFAKEAIQDRLESEEAARTKTFDQIMEPLYKKKDEVGEDEPNEMVDRAKARDHARQSRKKR